MSEQPEEFDTNLDDGPRLFMRGVTWLNIARDQFESSVIDAQSAATISAAAFAGAQAAAMGQLAMGETLSEELGDRWCAAIGDFKEEPGDHPELVETSTKA